MAALLLRDSDMYLFYHLWGRESMVRVDVRQYKRHLQLEPGTPVVRNVNTVDKTSPSLAAHEPLSTYSSGLAQLFAP